MAVIKRRMRRWFHCKICGVHFQIYFRNLGSLEGECDHDNARIYIDYNLARTRVFDVLHHELIHAIVYQSGSDKNLTAMVGLSNARWDVIDEHFASIYGNAQFATFADNGWLRFPSIPEWFDKP